MTLPVQDATGQIYVTFSDEKADQVIGMNVQQFLEFKQKSDEAEVEQYLDSQAFKRYTIVVRASQVTYNGETKVRYYAQRIQPVNIQVENKSLLNRLEIYDRKGTSNQIPDSQNSLGYKNEPDFGMDQYMN